MTGEDFVPLAEAIQNLPKADLSLPPVKNPRKKGKVFADKRFMLRMIEEIGDRENERIQLKTAKDVEKLKIVALREAAAARKKETKQERLRRIKEALRQKNRGKQEEGDAGDGGNGKGSTHRGADGKKNNRFREEDHAATRKGDGKDRHKREDGSRSGSNKKKVSFKE